MAGKPQTIVIGGEEWNAKWLRSVTLNEAIQTLRSNYEEDRIRNVWKQANGQSIRTTKQTDSRKGRRVDHVTLRDTGETWSMPHPDTDTPDPKKPNEELDNDGAESNN